MVCLSRERLAIYPKPLAESVLKGRARGIWFATGVGLGTLAGWICSEISSPTRVHTHFWLLGAQPAAWQAAFEAKTVNVAVCCSTQGGILELATSSAVIGLVPPEGPGVGTRAIRP